MSKNNNIVGLIVMLAVVLGLIGALVSYNFQGYSFVSEDRRVVLSESDNLIEVSTGDTLVKNNNVIVTDKFVGKIDKDSRVIAVGSDGSMYVVKEGTVLVSDMVVQNDEETVSVYRIDEPVKSVSSN